MRLKKAFIIHETGEGSMLVPTGDAGFAGLVRGNRTLGAILELLKSDTSEAEMVSALRARFDAPAEVIERDVRKALAELRRIGAVEET